MKKQKFTKSSFNKNYYFGSYTIKYISRNIYDVCLNNELIKGNIILLTNAKALVLYHFENKHIKDFIPPKNPSKWA